MRYVAKQRISQRLISAGYLQTAGFDRLLGTMANWNSRAMQKSIISVSKPIQTVEASWETVSSNDLRVEDKLGQFYYGDNHFMSEHNNEKTIISTLPIATCLQWLPNRSGSFMWNHQAGELCSEVSLILREGLQLNIIRTAHHFKPIALSVYAAKNSVLNLIDIHAEGNDPTYYYHEVQEGAIVNHLVMGKEHTYKARHVVETYLMGERAESHMESRFHNIGLVDLHHLAWHIASKTKSTIDVRSAGSGIFSQTMQTTIEQQAEESNASQIAKHLLAGERAQVFAEPLLFIFNKNVSCKHGIAIGAIDQEQLAYLQTRGLTKEQAESLLLDTNVLPSTHFSHLLTEAGL